VRKGGHFTEEHKRKISESLKGHIVTIETRMKIGKHRCNEESRKKMSLAHKNISDETRRKMSESHKGKQIGEDNPFYGKQHTKNTKEKLRQSNKGKHYSPSTEFTSELTKGKNNYNWKGGVTPIYYTIKTNKKYSEWRNSIFKRDKFSCVICGKVGGNLEAHHIKRFSKIVQYHEITNMGEASKCKELWDINNGVTLCKECHREIHSTKINERKVI